MEIEKLMAYMKIINARHKKLGATWKLLKKDPEGHFVREFFFLSKFTKYLQNTPQISPMKPFASIGTFLMRHITWEVPA